MDLKKWATVTKYYQAIWGEFSAQALSEVLDDNVTTFHVARQEKVDGVKNVVATYVKNFFDTVDLDSTRLFNFTMQTFNDNLECDVTTSYVLRQTHSNRGDTFGHVTEHFKLNSDSTRITSVTMDSHFKRDNESVKKTSESEVSAGVTSAGDNVVDKEVDTKADQSEIKMWVRFTDTIKCRKFCDKALQKGITITINDAKFQYIVTLTGSKRIVESFVASWEADIVESKLVSN